MEVVSEWPLLSWTELLHHFALTKTPPVAPHSVRRPHRALRNHTWAVLSTWSAGTFCHRSRELPQIRENPTAELETTSHSTQHTRGYLSAQDAIYMWSWHFTFALFLQLSYMLDNNRGLKWHQGFTGSILAALQHWWKSWFDHTRPFSSCLFVMCSQRHLSDIALTTHTHSFSVFLLSAFTCWIDFLGYSQKEQR